MARARRTKPRARAAPEPIVEFAPLELPPPPAKPVPPPPEPPKGSKPPPALVDMGDPPTDGLGLTAYAMRANAIALREVMLDESLSAAERRREIERLSRTIQSLRPDAEIWEAVESMRRHREQLEQPKRGAELVPVPEGTPDARPR